MMKKRICAVLLAAALLLGLAGCGEEEITLETDVTGTWVLESVKISGKTYVDMEYLGEYDYSFTFTEDGEAVAEVLGVNYHTTYEIKDGWIVFADVGLAAVKLKVNEDTLEMTVNPVGTGLVFRKE